VPQTRAPTKLTALARRGDQIGVFGSLVCALHCALTPMLLSLVPALGLGAFAAGDLDQIFAVFVGLLGISTLTIGYRRHRTFHAWLLLVPGLMLIWAGSFTSIHDHSATHVTVMVAGGLMVAAAHLLNLRLTHGYGATRIPEPASPEAA
jgi:hypothetical protein